MKAYGPLSEGDEGGFRIKVLLVPLIIDALNYWRLDSDVILQMPAR